MTLKTAVQQTIKKLDTKGNPQVITNGQFFFYFFISVISRPKKQRIKEQLALYELNLLLLFLLSKTPKFTGNFIIFKTLQ